MFDREHVAKRQISLLVTSWVEGQPAQGVLDRIIKYKQLSRLLHIINQVNKANVALGNIEIFDRKGYH